jgi:hypothetical protein
MFSQSLEFCYLDEAFLYVIRCLFLLMGIIKERPLQGPSLICHLLATQLEFGEFIDDPTDSNSQNHTKTHTIFLADGRQSR